MRRPWCVVVESPELVPLWHYSDISYCHGGSSALEGSLMTTSTPANLLPFARQATVWFAIAVTVVFGLRAVSTLILGADWETPGTGWRSVWQLVIVAIAVAALAWPQARAACVALIALIYVAATVAELAGVTALLGAVPVDMRDRWVHPLVMVLAIGALAADYARARRVSVAVA